MVNVTQSYEKFCSWVQNDISKDRVLVNRKILSVVVWCLLLPGLITIILYLNRKISLFNLDHYSDFLIFFPPMIYVAISLWPTLRDLPRVFSKGGLVVLIEDSQREVTWRESTALKMQSDLKFSSEDWGFIAFHLQNDLERVRDQNKYMTILACAVLFFMFQFLDLGAPTDLDLNHAAPQLMMKGWVDQFSQWSFQFFSLMVFSALFYLSGLQFHRHLGRYLVCVERILKSSSKT